jgi:hypothetical protein
MSEDKQETLRDIMRFVKTCMEAKKVGNIQVNFFKGGITSINLNETVKPGKE